MDEDNCQTAVVTLRQMIYQTFREMHRRRAPKTKFETYLSEELEAVAYEWRRIWIPQEPPNSKIVIPEYVQKPRHDDKKLSESDRKRVVILRTEHRVSVAELAQRFEISKQSIRRLLWEEKAQ
jgi:hypothetical protein